jgi:folate-binding protein YgfZ
MHNDRLLISLEDLGILRAHGPDTTRFLQGQLSNDLTRLAPEHSLLAGYHNPQGRTIALLRLIWLGAEDVLAVLPRELVPAVAARLSKFVLRAKVKIADESSSWRAMGLIGPDTAADIHSLGASAFARVGNSPPRWLMVFSASSPATASPPTGERRVWHRLDIESAQPQVFATTSEQFVAQLLNLDALDAISFEKGCYTGQEVIARAHFRGKVKRRLQRFVTRGPCELLPGTAGKLADGRPFKVVDAVQLDGGRCEFLAVAPQMNEEPPVHAERDSTASAEASDSISVDAEPLPLPYRLPD